jgi:hypothetical protein
VIIAGTRAITNTLRAGLFNLRMEEIRYVQGIILHSNAWMKCALAKNWD